LSEFQHWRKIKLTREEFLERLRLEYETIQKFRLHLSSGIYRWNQILFPLALTLLGLSLIYSIENWFYGFLVSTLLLVFWKVICHYLDKEIVNLYPRIIELEEKLGFEFTSRYYQRHIRDNMELAAKEELPYKELIEHAKKKKKISSRGHLIFDIFVASFIIVGIVIKLVT
jgi:hypothetical protein